MSSTSERGSTGARACASSIRAKRAATADRLEHPLGDGIPREALAVAGGARVAELPAQLRVNGKPAHAVEQGVLVAGRDQEAGLSLLDQLRKRAARAPDAGEACGHRLDHGHSERLV